MKPDFMNMVLPLLVVILMMPVGLYVTGNGNMIHGSGSISVYWAVSAALICTAFYYIVVKKIMSGKEYMASCHHTSSYELHYWRGSFTA